MEIRNIANKLVKSPLNYTGGKYKLLKQILPLLPSSGKCIMDLFCGGCNVGINTNFKKVICIDNQKHLIRFLDTIKNHDKKEIFSTIEFIIKKFGLSESTKYGYDYYGCSSGEGLGKYNRDKFLVLRDFYNNRSEDNFYFDMVFYTLTVYAFNNQIRFNKDGKYNIPVGKRDFNDKNRANLSDFIDKVQTKKVDFLMSDYTKLIDNIEDDNFFVYADPPYLITTATYNEQGGWNEENEKKLLELLDILNREKVKFALSNVLEAKGKVNHILSNWAKKYNVHYLNYSYKNSNYQKKNEHKAAKSVEVLITNY